MNPHNKILRDRHGRFPAKQTCRDNDPTCDFDGGVIGSCSFRVVLCVGVADPLLPSCTPAPLLRWVVMSPSEKQAARTVSASILRDHLLTVGEEMLSQAAGSCSAPLALSVPLRNTAKGLATQTQLVKTQALKSFHRRDTDVLYLTCTP